jgi:hypothetical protein
MGKYLCDLFQTFADIGALKVMNKYQILSMYLIANTNYGQQTGAHR